MNVGHAFSDRWRTWAPWAIAALALAALAIHAARQLPFIADDALISLRYARRLLHGQGLTFTDGPRVEGYSNLLWVLASAALGALGIDLIDASRILGLLGMAAATVLIVRWASTPLSALAGAFLFVLSPPIAVWTIGGLEQPFVAALLAAAFLLARPLVEEGSEAGWRAGIPLALLCLTRPDAPLLVAAMAAAVVLARGSSGLRPAAWMCLPPVVAVLGQTAFRLLYYGDWLPNPARVKVGFSATRALSGLHYLGDGALYLAGLLALAALALPLAIRDRALRPRLLLLGLPLVAWSAYVALVGGDIFPARRQLVPLVVLAAMLGADAVASLQRRSVALAAAALAASLGALVLGGPRDPAFLASRSERWEWDGKKVGEMLARAFGAEQPLVAVDAAGTLPYFSDLPTVDMLGLNDRWLPRHPPRDFGRGYMGHELGNGAYVLSREPDLVIPCIATGGLHGCFRSGSELLGMPAFRRAFVPLRFETPAPPLRSWIWARRQGGPIGIRTAEGSIQIPGYLLAASDATPATLDAHGRLGADVSTTAGKLEGVEIPAGSWVATAAADGDVQLSLTGASGFSASGPPPLRFEAPGGPLLLEVRAPDGAAHLREVRLAR